MKSFIIVPFLKASSPQERTAQSRLEEMLALVEAIDIKPCGNQIIPLSKPRASTYIGQGKVEELKDIFQQEKVEQVVFDGTLTPGQHRNLERAWKGVRVIDRSWLIMEIFARRARTNEARLQVQLAQMLYQKSNLVRRWTHLERQRAGGGFLGGAGETQLEMDRRRLDEKIVYAQKQLLAVKRTRDLHRKARKKVPYPVVALVGYTNAGKSTLFNKLSGAEVMAKDLLFATLDPTMRLLKLPSGRKVVLSDTVGFISNLPTDLIAAFRATLEEVISARIIIHVEDISHPEMELQRKDVLATLEALDIHTKNAQTKTAEEGQVDFINVLNKIDKIDAPTLESFQSSHHHGYIFLSAKTGEGIDALLLRCDAILRQETQLFEFSIPEEIYGRALAWLHEHAEVKNVFPLAENEKLYKVSAYLEEGKKGQFLSVFSSAKLNS